LVRCFDDGRLALDNNPVERALRCVAIGRKNYLFAGSDAGGRRAAAIYSLIESAKLNGLNPQHYLADVLARIADHPSGVLPNSCPVRRQRCWDNGLGKLREALAHQFADFRRPEADAASGGWRWSVV
jgi:hypothetical protein